MIFNVYNSSQQCNHRRIGINCVMFIVLGIKRLALQIKLLYSNCLPGTLHFAVYNDPKHFFSFKRKYYA